MNENFQLEYLNQNYFGSFLYFALRALLPQPSFLKKIKIKFSPIISPCKGQTYHISVGIF